MTRTPSNIRSVLSLSALAIFLTGAVLYAGPLDPPPGPITSTGKTLTEVEPRIAINAANTPGDADSVFKITTPGSYYLTGNIIGESGKHAIEIGVSNVSIDLMGFCLDNAANRPTLDGITGPPTGLVNVAVVNGTIEGWHGDGIDLATLTANVRLEGITVRGTLGTGMKVGLNAAVGNSAAFACASGIQTGDGSLVKDCTVRQSTVTNGITTGRGCTVTACTASVNTQNGIVVGAGSTVSGSTSSGNTIAGILASGEGCTISTCTASGNGSVGIGTLSRCTVSDCTANGNLSTGISAATGSTVSGCTADENAGIGIALGAGCTVTGCTARANALNGINGLASCVIRGNTCDFNGNGGNGAGIHTPSSGSRIEKNNCTGNDRGIQVVGADNIIIGNTCSGNSVLNWDIVAGNVCLVVRTNAAPAIQGDAGGSPPGSTDPSANFTY